MTHLIYAGLSDRNRTHFRLQVTGTTPDLVVQKVCDALKITKEQITSSCRKRNLSEARFIAIGLILESYPLRLIDIGAILGRDHSTIIHGRRTFDDLIVMSPEFRKKVALVRSFL